MKIRASGAARCIDSRRGSANIRDEVLYGFADPDVDAWCRLVASTRVTIRSGAEHLDVLLQCRPRATPASLAIVILAPVRLRLD